jgi:hypothetical protein
LSGLAPELSGNTSRSSARGDTSGCCAMQLTSTEMHQLAEFYDSGAATRQTRIAER